MYDYRNFRFRKLNTPEFSHLKLLLYWPVYGLAFLILERGLTLTYHPIYCAWDDGIPFCEYFVIPYYLWFVFLIGMLLYSLLFEIPVFRRYMWFIILTYSFTCVVYLVYPNCQQLRPVTFERDNVFTQVVIFLYGFDTNTNVCPSLHVIGSMAVLYAAWHSRRFGKTGWRIVFFVLAMLISFSTVFLKQHSIIDVIAGFAVSFAAYPFVYGKKPVLRFLRAEDAA